jgi:hypothetical protein
MSDKKMKQAPSAIWRGLFPFAAQFQNSMTNVLARTFCIATIRRINRVCPGPGLLYERPMRKISILPAMLLCAGLLAGCTTARSTAPLRTASEQLLISAAADRAAAQLSLGIPKGTRIFVDTR